MGAGASANGDNNSPLLDHCRQLFHQYDNDGTGELDWNEFWNVLSNLKLGLSDKDIAEWQSYADADKSGTVRWSEFEPMAGEVFKTYYQGRAGQGDVWVTKKDSRGRAYRLNEATGESKWVKKASPLVSHMKQLFIKHDADSSGSLSWEEFWYVISELNLGISDAEIGQWQTFADADGSGTIHWGEFEPMAEAMTNQFFSSRAAGDATDPWLVMTDPSGQSYRLNRITGEQSWIKAPESKDIDFSRFENDAAGRFKLSLSPALQNYIVNEFHKICGKDQVLEWDEFWRFMRNLDLGLSDHDIGALRLTADRYEDGVIDWEELVVMVEPLLGKIWQAEAAGAPEFAQWSSLQWDKHTKVTKTADGKIKKGAPFWVNKVTGERVTEEPTVYKDASFVQRKESMKLAKAPTMEDFLANAFKRQDKDNSGFLSASEMQNVIEQELHMDPTLSPAEMIKLTHGGDSNNDGKLTWQEFVAVLKPKLEAVFHERGDANQWVMMTDYGANGDSHFYWYNRSTGMSSWEDPNRKPIF